MMTAANDINITAAKNTQTQTVTDEKTDLYATATAGNKYIDVYNAGRDAHDAAKAVDEARENLHLMEKLHREGKSTLQAVDDAKTNLAFATANLASATVAGASSVSSAGSYTGSAYGTGFYGNVGLQADTSSDKAENSNIFYSGSSVNAGQNVNFTAGGNMIQSGSHVITKKGDVAYNIKNNLYLDAVGNSSSSSHTSKSGSVSVSVGLDSVSGSANVSVGSNRSSYTLYANSSTAAENGKITFNVGGDMAGVGYNGKAKDIKADVKGNLLLTSLQNSGSSSSTSSSYGVSGGTGSAGGSLGISSGNGSYQDTVVSSLIGTESVKINAGGKLGLSGSIIAHITNDGRDGGNLNIKAGSIEVTHLEDHNTNRQSGFNAGTNVGGIANDGAYPSGSTSIGLNRSGHEKEGMTYATIGSGNIAVADGGGLSELNRDIDNIKVTTKDVITGALDVNLSVDNRLFTQSGRDSIATDFTDIGANTKQIGKGMRDNIVSRAVYNAATDSEIGIIHAAKGYIKIDRSIGKIQDDKELTTKLNGLTNESAASVQDVAQSVANYANDNEDRTVEASIYSASGNTKGYAHNDDANSPDSYQIGINVKNVDIANSGEFINISYHETTNIERHTQSEKVAGDDRTAKNRGNTAEGVWGLKNFGNADTNQISGSDWLSKNKDDKTILSGTQKAINHLTNNSGNKNFSTWGYYDKNYNSLVINDAVRDGDTGVYMRNDSNEYLKSYLKDKIDIQVVKKDGDEYIMIGESWRDDSFIAEVWKTVNTTSYIDYYTGETIPEEKLNNNLIDVIRVITQEVVLSKEKPAVNQLIHLEEDYYQTVNNGSFMEKHDSILYPIYSANLKDAAAIDYDKNIYKIDEDGNFNLHQEGGRTEKHYSGALYYGKFAGYREVGNQKFGEYVYHITYDGGVAAANILAATENNFKMRKKNIITLWNGPTVYIGGGENPTAKRDYEIGRQRGIEMQKKEIYKIYDIYKDQIDENLNIIEKWRK